MSTGDYQAEERGRGFLTEIKYVQASDQERAILKSLKQAFHKRGYADGQ